LPPVNLKNIKEREEENIKERELILGKDVSNYAQEVFDGLIKSQLPCEWKGEKIIVMDCIQIEKPYKLENVTEIDKNNNNSEIMERIKKIVSFNNYYIVEWSNKKNKKISIINNYLFFVFVIVLII
jgi:hypothetical protein